MVTVHAKDEANYLMFTEGYVPEIPEIEAAWPQTPKFISRLEKNNFSRDAALARTFNACALRLAHHRREQFGGFANGQEVPLDTLVIGAPPGEDALLSEWFEGEKSPERYRILAHRSPSVLDGTALPRLWSSVHKANRRRGHLKLEHRYNQATPPKQLIGCTMDFLTKLGRAYRGGKDAVRELLDGSDHEYYASFGLYTSDNNSL